MLPRATRTDPSKPRARIAAEDEQITERAAVSPVPGVVQEEEQTTDLTGRPGTPSAVRKRVQGRSRSRSLLGPEAYDVGDGIRPQVPTGGDEKEELELSFEDRPTEVGADPWARFERPLAAQPDLAEWEDSLAEWEEDLAAWEEPEETPPAMPPPLPPVAAAAFAPEASGLDARTDPFGVHLPADEVDIIAAAGGSMPDWDGWESSFFERETEPLDPRLIPRPPPRPHSLAAAVAVFSCGLIAVVVLSISAWIALSREGPAHPATSPTESVVSYEDPAGNGTTYAEEPEVRQDTLLNTEDHSNP
ncbi:MAG: hypothetical protein JRI25_14180 [Deltaproteobacteria bacterium]|nr:hypothetical protein [Deltaproteobacteria bacterium]